jgi:hypothetical protein
LSTQPTLSDWSAPSRPCGTQTLVVGAYDTVTDPAVMAALWLYMNE